jgi:hypothetical protein
MEIANWNNPYILTLFPLYILQYICDIWGSFLLYPGAGLSKVSSVISISEILLTSNKRHPGILPDELYPPT